MEYRKIDYAATRAFVEAVFTGYGFSPEESRKIADVLLSADLYGIESHGVQRLIRYYGAIEEGSIDPGAGMTLLHETPISRVYDAPRSDAVKVTCEVVASRYRAPVSEIEILLHGGKTHQLRAQLAHSGHFIVGDGKYGDDRINKRLGYTKQQLTAIKLGFALSYDPLGYNGRTIELPDKHN